MSEESKQKKTQVDAILEDLQSSKVDTKNDALKKAKQFMTDERVKKTLREICENEKEHQQFRINVMKVICSDKKPQAETVDMLARLAKNKTALIRRYAVIYLSEVGGKKALPILSEALKDENHWVRLFALKGAKNLTDLKSPSSEAITIAVKALGDENEEIRLEAIRIVEWMGKVTIKELIKQSKEGNKQLKYAATGILGRFNTEETNKHLVDLLDSGNDRVVRIAVKYLGDNKVHEAAPKLLGLAENKQNFRELIAIALFKHGYGAIVPLIQGLAKHESLKGYIFDILKKFLPNGADEIENNIPKAPKEMQADLRKMVKQALEQ